MKAEPCFYSLKVASDKLHTDPEFIIDEWLQQRIPLYIKLDSLSCGIVRYISADSFLLKYEMEKIKNGMDYYQHELMPEFKVRQFHPIKNAKIDAKVINNELGLSRFSYNGYAYGYWRVKPTKTTHFSRGKFILPDLNLMLSGKDILESITIHGRNDSDYLILLNNGLRVKVELYIESGFLEVLKNNLLVDNGDTSSKFRLENDLCDVKEKEGQTSVVEAYKVALYIFIHEWLQAEKYGKLIINKLVSRFKDEYKLNISHATIKRWADKSKINSSHRTISNQKKALSILINEVCEMKKIKKEYKAVATMLNEVVQSGKYNFNYKVVFSDLEVKKWLM